MKEEPLEEIPANLSPEIEEIISLINYCEDNIREAIERDYYNLTRKK